MFIFLQLEKFFTHSRIQWNFSSGFIENSVSWLSSKYVLWLAALPHLYDTHVWDHLTNSGDLRVCRIYLIQNPQTLPSEGHSEATWMAAGRMARMIACGCYLRSSLAFARQSSWLRAWG